MNAPNLRQVTVHRGCTLSWFIEGSGPPVVMVQGIGVGASGWRPQAQALSAHFHCLCFDNRGFGASHAPDGELTVELMAEDVLALMDARGWRSAHVMGHSLGGLVALYAARRNRERVRSLSLLCTFPSGAIPTRLTPWMLWVAMRTRVGTARMRRHAFLELVLPRDALAGADRDALAAHDRIAPPFGAEVPACTAPARPPAASLASSPAPPRPPSSSDVAPPTRWS